MARLSKLVGFGLTMALLLSSGLVITQDVIAQDAEDPAEPEGGEVSDVIVVTASRTEQRLQEVPVAMTVISAEELATMPADDYGDVLRNVPGLNVTQISARDVQINTRKASGSLSTDQLVLLDGRSVYLDFFGFVMWDLLPLNFNEIAQIEVVRGPGSAVWGANALGGVINLITKSPWEAAGTSVQLGGGELSTLYGSIAHAAGGEKVGYKISASYFEQDPYDRPTGIIQETEITNPPGTPYPAFENEGTEQPKLDFRVDYNQTLDTSWSFSGGYAGTDGIVHSGIGPFDVDPSSNLSYFKVSYAKKALVVNAYANLLDGESSNLLTRGLDDQPLILGFESQTYNVDFANTHVLGGDRHVVTYGATARTTDFELSIAPNGRKRDEYGLFLQDEISLGDKVRWLVGARFDDIDTIGSVVSPRTSLMFAPSSNHNFRISYNEAFRAASVVENFLGINIVNDVLLPPIPPFTSSPSLFTFPSATAGNPNLEEESLEAFEVGYVGTFADNKATVTVAVYRNELIDGIDFFTSEYYDSFNPPPGWPIPPLIPTPFGLIQTVPENTFPSLFTYRNIGSQINEGFEFSFDYRPATEWRFGINYSYQEEPEVTGIDPREVNTPPENRLNLSLAYSGARFFADLNVNYVDSARWTDVLDSRFHGVTDDYTMTNLSVGVRLRNDQVTLSVIGTNIFDDEILQHVFGDIIARKVSGQVSFRF